MSKTKARKLLLRAVLPFLLLAAIVVGIYYWFFAPKSYEDLIPAESKAVVTIDIAQSPQARELLTSLAQQWDIDLQGINPKGDVFLVVTPNEYFALVAEVKDAARLKTTINTLASKQKVINVQQADGITYAWIQAGWQLAVSDKALAIVGPGTVQQQPELQQTLRQMYRSPRSQSFRHSDYYDSFSSLHGAVRLYARLNVLPAPFNMFFRMNLPSDADPSRVALYAGVEADDAAKPILLKGSIKSLDEATEAALTNFERQSASITAETLENINDDVLCFFAAAPPTGHLLKLMRSDAKTRSMLLALNQTINANSLLDAINGNVSLTLTSLDKDFTPTFFFEGKTGREDLMKDAPKWMEKAASQKDVSLVKEGEGYCLTGKDGTLRFGQHGDRLYFRSSATPYTQSSATGSLSAKAVGSKMFMHLNLKKLFEQPCIPSDASSLLSRFYGNASALTYKQSEGGKVEIIINR